jgi:hypothetical protein
VVSVGSYWILVHTDIYLGVLLIWHHPIGNWLGKKKSKQTCHQNTEESILELIKFRHKIEASPIVTTSYNIKLHNYVHMITWSHASCSPTWLNFFGCGSLTNNLSKFDKYKIINCMLSSECNPTKSIVKVFALQLMRVSSLRFS